jgi:hypothetical protein
MLTIVNSPLKIGLKVEHEGAYYKIINFYRQQNSVNQYIIQSLSTGKTKRVYRPQALISFKKYMPPPFPYFKVSICTLPLPLFASIFFAYL